MPPLRGFLILQWTRSTQMPSLRDLRAHIYLTFSTLCVRVLGPKHFFKTKKYLFFLKLTPIVRLQTAPANFIGYRSNMGTGNELPYYELPEFGHIMEASGIRKYLLQGKPERLGTAPTAWSAIRRSP